jgi:hypothetical protein
MAIEGVVNATARRTNNAIQKPFGVHGQDLPEDVPSSLPSENNVTAPALTPASPTPSALW